ncbi:MAG: SRPBCC domain-containing protein [Solirubrobacterales bacterium]
MSQAQANDTRQAIASDKVVTMPSEHQIVTERVFDAPREWAFAAFSDPDLIRKWWGPRRLRTVVERMDVRSGGGWRFACHDSKGPVETFRGTYRELLKPFECRRRRSPDTNPTARTSSVSCCARARVRA